MTLSTVLVDARKCAVAVAGLLAQVIELGVLHGQALHYAQVASGALATVLVYLVRNGPQEDTGDGTVPAVELATPPADSATPPAA